MDGGSIVVEVRADLARFDREMARARAQVADAESRRGAWTTTGRGRRDADAFLAETRALRQRADALQENVRAQERLAAADRRASLVARVGAVGLALNRAGANLQELSDNPGAWSSRAGGFLTNITSGNFIGAVKAAGAESKLTAEQIQRIGTSSDVSDAQLRKFAAGLRALGQTGAAEELARIRQEMRDTAAMAEWSRNQIVASFNRGEPQATFGITPLPPRQPKPPGTGDLNLWRQRQTAIAAATPGTADDIREARKNIQAYRQMIKEGNLTENGVTRAYQQIAAERAHIKSLTPNDPKKEQPILPPGLEFAISKAQLTKKTTDDLAALRNAERYLTDRIEIEKDINRKIEMTNRLGQIRGQIAGLGKGTSVSTTAASVLGALFGGEYLTGDRMQFAQSFGYTPKPRDFLKDVKQGNAQANRFLKDIGVLRRKGASESLISELAALGPQAGDQIHALAGSSQQFIGAYSAAVDRRQELAAQTVRLQEMTVTAGQVTINTGSVVGGNGAGRTLTSTSTVDRFQMTHGAF